MKKMALIASGVIALATMVLWAPPSEAYYMYSEGEIDGPRGEEPYGYCKTCHGNFLATNSDNSRVIRQDEYVSPTDGKVWDETYAEWDETEPDPEIGLHDVHRHIMLDKLSRSKCSVCHLESGRYPVVLNSSSSTFLEPIGCAGCHGRREDVGNPVAGSDMLSGLSAGLRQHHTNAGVPECKTCHADADPANYTPVGEDVLPPYYTVPNGEFPNKPTDPCNQNRDEDYAGGPRGLDNDGDGRYDMRDSDCTPVAGR